MITENVLSPECETLLRKWDMGSQSDINDNSPAEIYDADAEFVMRVSRTISHFDLLQMLYYGKRQFDRGERFGKCNMQRQLCILIGAKDDDELPPNDQAKRPDDGGTPADGRA